MRPDEIATALRRAVRERAIPPGQALNQDELARRYGVSRIPLREALRTLVGEGLIIMKPGLGAVVTELNVGEVQELYSLRMQLEPPLAADIVAHAGRRDVDDLARLVEAMQALQPEQSEEWSSLNYRFHRRLYELSGQRHSVRLVVQVLNLVEPYARVHAHVIGSRPQMQQERVEMVQALRDADDARVRAIIEQSIRTARAELEMSMGEAAPLPDAADL
ncbi:GntR family transcriptional regulator [Pedococcus sp. NPDC057267]|uniref:GntR family transcriptional regulator n=1 Tax=Pedococcus sp. NPDC057267 TaxID=3346077 RepID=UPI00362CB040